MRVRVNDLGFRVAFRVRVRVHDLGFRVAFRVRVRVCVPRSTCVEGASESDGVCV